MLQKRTSFFDLFEEEIVDETKLKMYLSPSVTEAGYVVSNPFSL